MDRKLLPDSEIYVIPEIQFGIPSDREDSPEDRSTHASTEGKFYNRRVVLEGPGVIGGLFPAPHPPVIDPRKTLPGRTSNMTPVQHNYNKRNTAGCRRETNR